MAIGNSATRSVSTHPAMSQNEYRLKTFYTSMNLLAHILIGFVVGGALIFAFRSGLHLGATSIHIVLCVLGYQLLMGEAILSLSPHNGWSTHLRLRDKKLAHWTILVVGASLAIAGSFVKILDKTSHWTSYHGQFALVALVFTTVSVVSGSPLWALEVRRHLPIPAKPAKLIHICLGIVGFASSTITLCHGFEKRFFRAFTGDAVAYTLMSFAACYTAIIILNPVISFVNKIKSS